MSISQMVVGLISFIALLIFIDQRGSSAIPPLVMTGAILVGGLVVYGVLDLIHQRQRIENHRLQGIANQEHARALTDEAKAAKPVAIPGVPHLVWILRDGEYQAVPIPPAPTINQDGDVITPDEKSILDGCSRLVVISKQWENQGASGTRIAPASVADGQLGVKWMDATDYMVKQGWIIKEAQRQSLCKSPTGNLEALALAIAIRALPRRERPTA